MIIHKPNPRDGVLKFVARSEDEFRAYLDAAIEAAREPYDRGNALRLDVGKPASWEPGGDDDELAEPAPQAAPRPRDLQARPRSRRHGVPRQRGRHSCCRPQGIHQCCMVFMHICRQPNSIPRSGPGDVTAGASATSRTLQRRDGLTDSRELLRRAFAAGPSGETSSRPDLR
jgi:hypothetical protein